RIRSRVNHTTPVTRPCPAELGGKAPSRGAEMPRRPLSFVILATTVAARIASAQMIQIKTLPITEGDQWRFFPSANQALGGISIALADSLLDPFENPAKGSR